MSLLLETVLQHPLRSPSTTAPYKRTFMNCLFAPLFWLKVRVWTVHHSFTKTPLESKLIPTDVQKTSYSVLLSVTSGSSADCFPISSWMNVQSLPSSLDVEPLPAALRSQQLTCTNPPTLPSQCCWLTPALHSRHTEGSGLWLHLIFWDKFYIKDLPTVSGEKAQEALSELTLTTQERTAVCPVHVKIQKETGKAFVWSDQRTAICFHSCCTCCYSASSHLFLISSQHNLNDTCQAPPDNICSLLL